MWVKLNKETLWWIPLFVILSTIDLILTYFCVSKYGIFVEGNPIYRWLISQSWQITIIFKLYISTSLTALIFMFVDTKLVKAVTIAFLFIIINNTLVLLY